ncbi:MAG: sulfotransferase [Cryomorphaceae bacterium]
MDHLMGGQVDTLLITGTGRSGTNILKKILSGHSEMASLPFEYRFIIDPDGVIDFYRTYPVLWSPYRADKLIKRFEHFLKSLASLDGDKAERTAKALALDPSGLELSPPPYSGWELEKWIPGYGDLIDAMINEIRSFEYAGIWPGTDEGEIKNQMYFAPPMTHEALRPIVSRFIQGCIDSIRRSQEKSIFQEDNTHNLLAAQDLLTLIPNGKMIHIVRDPRDVLSSLQTQRWAPSSLGQLIHWYKGVMNTWFAQREALPADRYLEIKFEDLVSSPKQTLSQVCAFVGIALEANMLELDLGAHHMGRHKDSFTSAEIHRVEDSLGRFMREYGYTVS